MNKASKELIGLNDFYAFCKSREGSTTIRNLIKFNWTRKSDYVICEVIADAFCYSMVRGLVASIIQVGDGKELSLGPKKLCKSERK